MTTYKHTQIGYLMLTVTAVVFALFVSAHIMSLSEPASIDSGTNLAVTAVMLLILLILVSFTTLTTSIDGQYLRIKFGYGIFNKKFLLSEIASATSVKNRWYYGWGVKVWFWPYMWIYNISGFDAVEIVLKNGKIYRIGTDAPKELEEVIKKAIC
ncbi:MAG: hypothetical protein V4469_03120 [Patescibacteria group bacterium]